MLSQPLLCVERTGSNIYVLFILKLQMPDLAVEYNIKYIVYKYGGMHLT